VSVSLERITDAAMGNRFVSAAVAYPTRHQLRVLAYHGVHDVATFEEQMAYLRAAYEPVSAARVLAAVGGGTALPPRSVWVTFDDGSPTIVERALPVLVRYDIPSTMFVCPGVIGTETPYWWQTVEQAWAAGVRPSVAGVDQPTLGSVTSALKTIPDVERRAIVAEAARSLARSVGSPPTEGQITSEQIGRYLDAGGTLGNHTWDHPCLNTCAPDEALDQVARAHRDLASRFGPPPNVFASPNGDYAAAAEEALAALGYDIGLLFDHRVATPDEPPLRTSRLRVNDNTTLNRYRSILSGAHPALLRARHALSIRTQGSH
jgi:peptidoglycan/xylan/chitin deacetylase (PgdA/CDA1 family)